MIGNIEADTGTSWNGKYITNDYGQREEEEKEYWSLMENKTITKENGKEAFRRERLSGYSDTEDAPEGAEKKMVMREVINPDYDPDKKYMPREDRPEWNVVGLVGRLRITKGQPTAPSWIKLRDISDKVEEWLIK